MGTTKKETHNNENIKSCAQITIETLETEEEPTNFGFSALNGKFRSLEKKYKLLQDKLFELTTKMETIIKSLRR